MATIMDRLNELLTEQHTAINAVESCRRQIAALLMQQWHRQRLEQDTSRATGNGKLGPQPKYSEPNTQSDGPSDEDLLEALRVYEAQHPPLDSAPTSATAPTHCQPPQKKAKCQEQTITDQIFDFIGNLDDQHLMTASCVAKAEIEYRQEKSRER